MSNKYESKPNSQSAELTYMNIEDQNMYSDYYGANEDNHYQEG
jgi:hypothetical protein